MTEERLKMAEEGFLTISDAERFTGMKRSTLYNLMQDGTLPYAKVGKARRIPKKSLIEFMAGNLVLRGE